MTLNIVKVDREHPDIRLKGAQFELDRYTAPDSPEGSHSWTPVGDTQTTGPDGTVSFTNLLHGCYRISEIKAPAGYMYTGSGMFYVRIDENGMTLLSKGDGLDPTQWPAAGSGLTGDVLVFTTDGQDSLSKIATVGNKTGTVLPSTGGEGTGAYTLTGLVLIMAAGILMLVRRRRDRAGRE